MEPIQAWPGGQVIKEQFIAGIARHEQDDDVIQGTDFAHVLGVPLQVAYVVDAIHEELAPDECVKWTERVARALEVGADTTHVWTKFAIWLLNDECSSDEGRAVAQRYRRRLAGDEPSDDEWSGVEWRAARVAARMASAVAQSVVRGERAASAVRVAAESAATRITTGMTTGAENREACYRRMADKLIEIFERL